MLNTDWSIRVRRELIVVVGGLAGVIGVFWLMGTLIEAMFPLGDNGLDLKSVRNLSSWVASHEWALKVSRWVEHIGDIWVSAISFFILIVLASLLRRFSAPFLIFSALIGLTFLANFAIRILVARPRPPLLHLTAVSTYSFPSGHAARSLALFLGCAYVASAINGSKHGIRQCALWIASALAPVFVALSRAGLGAHYMTDLIGGLGQGVACFMVIYWRRHALLQLIEAKIPRW